MLHLTIVCVGKLKEQFFIDAVREYQKRLTPYCKLSIEEVPGARLPVNATDKEKLAALAKEAGAVELRIPDDCLLIALCVEGKQLNTDKFAAFIKACELSAKNNVCFLIGGSIGLHQRLKNRAEINLSMSEMTFPHHLFRVMLLEQLYRGFKINEGSPYHK
ncbi:MAG: 23S rRNA (pseudouridine(1915)-N(3))-methyltransferase RlmH [Oscillospiraceae bacterium]|jgi:23S rRNA (pseudouridine1915-N3)-methyltransferase|nr:23S rRNA (pseudouridine(1915)-N(3))-methyltransferase RlmH [Oscillospiraceae bacterium]